MNLKATKIFSLDRLLQILYCMRLSRYTQDQKERLVQRYLPAVGVADDKVKMAIEKVRREKFLPREFQEVAYIDRALPIDEDQTISQPSLVALMTQELHITKKSKVLEIGTGSGYQTAVLAELAKKVFTVEVRRKLSDNAKKLLHKLGYENIAFRNGDGTHGWSEKAPYDGIIVTAAASFIPPALVSQLKDDGRMLIPLEEEDEQQGLYLIRKAKRKWIEQRICSVHFVPLVSYDPNF